MSLTEENLNPDRKLIKKNVGKLKHSSSYFWDTKKLRVLDLVLFGKQSLKSIGEDPEVLQSVGTIAKWLNSPEFKEQYDRIIEAAMSRRKAKEVAIYEDMLDKLSEVFEANYKKLDPNKVMEELRKILKAREEMRLPNSMIIARDSTLNIVSPRAVKMMEESVLRSRGYQKLDVSEEEKNEIKIDESNNDKSTNPGSGSALEGVDPELDRSDRSEDGKAGAV